jgi:hypothetical protein
MEPDSRIGNGINRFRQLVPSANGILLDWSAQESAIAASWGSPHATAIARERLVNFLRHDCSVLIMERRLTPEGGFQPVMLLVHRDLACLFCFPNVPVNYMHYEPLYATSNERPTAAAQAEVRAVQVELRTRLSRNGMTLEGTGEYYCSLSSSCLTAISLPGSRLPHAEARPHAGPASIVGGPVAALRL